MQLNTRRTKRFFSSRDVQNLIFLCLETGEWLTIHELAERIADNNSGRRIRPHVRDAAIARLYNQAFVELRMHEVGLVQVVQLRARNDAHRQWRCGAKRWKRPPSITGSHKM